MKFENNIILMIVAAVAIYAIFLFISDYQKISDVVIDFRIEYLIPILSLVTVSWIPLILMWHLLLKKNGIIIIHRHKKEEENYPKKFNILKIKTYGISKIIFGN